MSKKKEQIKLGVGLLGLGTVGSGVIDILSGEHANHIAIKAQSDFCIKGIAVKNLTKKRDCAIDSAVLTDDIATVINHPEIDIIVELIGGVDEAYQAVSQALQAKKAVITANKELIAMHGQALFELAESMQVPLLYEASVAGGIPIIKVLREAMDANKITTVAGIINGTCNYILSRMRDEKIDFQAVLADAQQLGYAEADPTFDIEGIDAGHKLTILCALATGCAPQFKKVYTEGITQITVEDIVQANKMGYQIKHLGIAQINSGQVEMRVHPALVADSKLLSGVDGVMNAVWVEGDALGESMYYGAGAGRLPTASAVVADLCEIGRCLHQGVQPANFSLNGTNQVEYKDISEIQSSYYVRLKVPDEPGVLKSISESMAKHSVSIEVVHQEQPEHSKHEATIVLLTNMVMEKNIKAALEEMSQQINHSSPALLIRVFS